MLKFVMLAFANLALATAIAEPGFAQPRIEQKPRVDQRGPAPTNSDEIACEPDAKKYCSALLDLGDLLVLGCLQMNRSKLAPQCRKVLEDHGV